MSDTKSNNPVPNFYRASAEDFKKIPGSPIAYWLNNNVRNLFIHSNLGEICETRLGMATADNDKFLRLWHEVKQSSFSLQNNSREETQFSGKKWFPYQKGGNFRKWYGNLEYLVNWENDGSDIRNFINPDTGKVRSHNYNLNFIFNEGITWNALTSSKTSARISKHSLFDNAGSSLFAKEPHICNIILSYINCNLITDLISLISPTLNYQPGDIAKLPAVFDIPGIELLNINTEKLISLSSIDWDSYETSWDFSTLPLLTPEYLSPTIEASYQKIRSRWQDMTNEVQSLEEENNRIFIEAYGLEDDLTPDVPLSEITLTCNPHYRYNSSKSEEELESRLLADTIKELISYAVGCMVGRYGLDKPGLILANQGETTDDYLNQIPQPSFKPDDDNIIPVLDDEYFTDDIVSRFKDFLKVVFGEKTLSQNLDYIAQALTGKTSSSPEKVIREYFMRDFFKDHLQRYKKRPIYWMFSSGKQQGFNVLVYMHRYNKTTLAKMRTDYLLELEAKLDAELNVLNEDVVRNKTRITKIKKQIEEMKTYDELLNNKALAMIDIDLDDGVVVNYAKFEGLVRPI